MMENSLLKDIPPKEHENNLKDEESAVNFQKFIYDLFEKKGVLNDLRASLRGHIVEVLKSAQTGEPPTCQKHFTQRLDLSYQAVNILIAEYFLRLEFGYSLSVFVSELPLANMVFEFAKSLIENKDIENLKFKECDVWSILNYLGVKCDSNCATNILQMYNNKENVPLLLCILTCTSVYRRESGLLGQDNVSCNSLSSSAKSLSSLDKDIPVDKASKIASDHDRCRHYAFCKTCQAKMKRMKQKYQRSRKTHLVKKVKSWNANPQIVKLLMRNVADVEDNLVEEMFQQLKSVYEAEMGMMKQNDEKVIKRSLASHALQLQKRREEKKIEQEITKMEESFKAREAQLERNVREKKEFLWGLARALRQQHAQMSRAMEAVRCETDRLTAKEESLKYQLLEAENVLKNRGEDMRKQISDELVVLESHLESMKKERDNINKERKELEHIKSACDTNSQVIKVHDLTHEELRSHYDLLKDELGILRKYLETTKLEPKCVIDRSTLTEISNISSKINLVLNNEQEFDKNTLKSDSDDRIRTPNKVVNDLKKQKNVNFCKSKIDELYRETGRDRSRSSGSSEAGDALVGDRDLIERLWEENERLKTFASQQREHIDELSSHGARLRAELAAARFQSIQSERRPLRPRTAPAVYSRSCASSHAVGWRKGAGEEMSIFSNAQPRILLPGDTLPFVGVLRDRQDSRRHLINQWRSLRRRSGANAQAHIPRSALKESPLKIASPLRAREVSPSCVAPMDDDDCRQMNENFAYRPIVRQSPKTPIETHQPREKSPKSVLKEVKEKLIKYNYTHEQPTCSSRDKSPTFVLREAKTRLRKLEIEAEAVEKSYLNFRRRQDMMKQGRESNNEDNERLDFQSRYTNNKKETKLETEPRTSSKTLTISADFDRYKTIVNALTNYKNRNTGLLHTRPIPPAYSKLESELKDSQQRQNYYLETPLEEFRKLYRSQRSPGSSERSPDRSERSPDRSEKSPDRSEKSPDRSEKSPDRSEISYGDKFGATSSHKDFNNLVINEKQDLVASAILNEHKVIVTSVINENEELVTLGNNEDKELDTFIINEKKLYEKKEKPKSARRHKNKKDELEILKDNINKIYNLNPNDLEAKIAPIEESIENIDKEAAIIEGLKLTHHDGKPHQLLLEIESTVDTQEIDISETEMHHEKISTQMTIIVSPLMDKINDRADSRNDKRERSMSPEQAAKLTRNDALNAIYHADPDKVFSSVETELDVSKREESVTDEENGGCDDYPDDFSADVDNYNSRSDFEVANSPISLPKNLEDDSNFWDA